jgi:PrtD family type I secretion system ABC transporter
MDEAIDAIRPALVGALVISFFTSLLYFVVPIYTIQIFERVALSRNATTLTAVTVIAIVLILVDAVLAQLRAASLQRAAISFDKAIAGLVFEAAHRRLLEPQTTVAAGSLADVDTLRGFIAGPAFASVLLAVFSPLYFLVLWLFHPLLLLVALVALAVIAGLTYLGLGAANQASTYAARGHAQASEFAAALFQSHETIQALGMRRALRDRWLLMHDNALSWANTSDDLAARYTVLLQTVRTVLGVLIFAVGAAVMIGGGLSLAVLFAASIVAGKAISPIQAVIGNGRAILAAIHAYRRLHTMLQGVAGTPAKVQLPEPDGRLTLEGVAISPPGQSLGAAILRGISFDLPAGTALAVIGPSAAGKTTLLKTIVGAWKPALGQVRLDGSELTQWDDALGLRLGYLSADVDLFPGTIAENIRRFTPAADDAVVDAARRANVHEMIVQLPYGYDTRVDARGTGLSSGQRQRIGLARAVFGNPRLIVLDEPNANLDSAGEEDLVRTLSLLRKERRTVVFVTHKASLVRAADFVLVLGGGTVQDFGPRDAIINRLVEPRAVPSEVARLPAVRSLP